MPERPLILFAKPTFADKDKQHGGKKNIFQPPYERQVARLSPMRHLAKHLSGMTDERHEIAAAWNILWAIQTAITHPEMTDVPWSEPEQTEADSTASSATVPCESCRYAGNSVEPCTWCVYCGGDKDAPSYWQPKPET